MINYYIATHAYLTSSLIFLCSYSCCVLLRKVLSANDVDLSERERMTLVLGLRTVVMSTVENDTLKSE